MSCRIKFEVEVVIEPDETEFHAYCPALKGLHVGGATIEEALDHVNHAIACHMTSIMKHGDPIPKGVIVSRIEMPESKLRLARHATIRAPTGNGRRLRHVNAEVSLAFT
jgi:predicted RNase H-like HicB family nuclease